MPQKIVNQSFFVRSCSGTILYPVQGFPGIKSELQGFQELSRTKIDMQAFPGGVRTLLY